MRRHLGLSVSLPASISLALCGSGAELCWHCCCCHSTRPTCPMPRVCCMLRTNGDVMFCHPSLQPPPPHTLLARRPGVVDRSTDERILTKTERNLHPESCTHSYAQTQYVRTCVWVWVWVDVCVSLDQSTLGPHLGSHVKHTCTREAKKSPKPKI